MNIIPKFLIERLSKVEDVHLPKEDCVVIPRMRSYGGYPE